MKNGLTERETKTLRAIRAVADVWYKSHDIKDLRNLKRMASNWALENNQRRAIRLMHLNTVRGVNSQVEAHHMMFDKGDN